MMKNSVPVIIKVKKGDTCSVDGYLLDDLTYYAFKQVVIDKVLSR